MINENGGFSDPYGEEKEKVRLQTWVSLKDHDIVMSIRPTKGTIQVINNMLWYRFCQQLRKAGITSLEHKLRLEQAVAGIEVTFKKKGK